MARKKNKYPLIEGLEIIDVAAEGKALGKYNDVVVFVPFTVPGDIVDVQICNKRRRFMEGYVVRYVKYSQFREQPFCGHYGDCGGCKWQNLPYDKQLEYKQRQVKDQLTRIGKVELPEISPIIGSENIRYYRNKLEFAFSDKRWIPYKELENNPEVDREHALGFHITGMFDKILDIEQCYLQREPSNAIRNAVKEFTKERGYSYYDVRNHDGFMRNIVIRTASSGDVMVIVVFAYEDRTKREELLDFLKERFPEITSLIYIINDKLNDSYGDLPVNCYYGKDYIVENMEGLRFKVGPKSFYQTNSEQAYELYKVTREFAGLTGNEVVYDLYTGTGTIANFVALRAKKVVGVEYVPEAIEDARENSAFNHIGNTVFYAGDMKDVLNDAFIEENGKPDVIILDPPRTGIHEEVAETVLRAAPRRIVYVSCNPATQARDVAILDRDYKVEKVQPVDMFPHTHHVENVVLLLRRE
ncbi:MAG TPA: 23S rRNA (uracil(1939)-C(5))-methyltransferase RlmD [Candidatus Avirikenella pullistercoris]|nr:23S rRNA (uracil(1939)-C(5))-methyltransferase RlmD [Candidatus Avirikenella pullistercoris]